MTDSLKGNLDDPNLLVFRDWANSYDDIFFDEDLLKEGVTLQRDVPKLIADDRAAMLTDGIIKWIYITHLGTDSVGVAKLHFGVQYTYQGKVYAFSNEFGVQEGDTVPLRFLFVKEDPVIAATLEKGIMLFKVQKIHDEGDFIDIGPVEPNFNQWNNGTELEN